MITYRNRLDVTPGKVPLRIDLSQYDDDFVLEFEPFSSVGTFVLESGTTAEIRGTKMDGNGYSEDATISNGIVTVTGDQQMTAVSGDHMFEIVFKKNTKELNTANFILRVERAALDIDTITSGSKIREVVEISGDIDEILDELNAARDYIDQYIDGLVYGDEVGY